MKIEGKSLCWVWQKSHARHRSGGAIRVAHNSGGAEASTSLCPKPQAGAAPSCWLTQRWLLDEGTERENISLSPQQSSQHGTERC